MGHGALRFAAAFAGVMLTAACATSTTTIRFAAVRELRPGAMTEEEILRRMDAEPLVRLDLGLGTYALIWMDQSYGVVATGRKKTPFAVGEYGMTRLLSLVFDERRTFLGMEYVTADADEQQAVLPIRDYHVRREGQALIGDVRFPAPAAAVFDAALRIFRERGYAFDPADVNREAREARNMRAKVGPNREGIRQAVTSFRVEPAGEASLLTIRTEWRSGTEPLGTVFVEPRSSWGASASFVATEYLVGKELGLPFVPVPMPAASAKPLATPKKKEAQPTSGPDF